MTLRSSEMGSLIRSYMRSLTFNLFIWNANYYNRTLSLLFVSSQLIIRAWVLTEYHVKEASTWQHLAINRNHSKERNSNWENIINWTIKNHNLMNFIQLFNRINKIVTRMKLGLLRLRQLKDAMVHSGVPLYCVWQKLWVWASRIRRGSSFSINWRIHVIRTHINSIIQLTDPSTHKKFQDKKF